MGLHFDLEGLGVSRNQRVREIKINLLSYIGKKRDPRLTSSNQELQRDGANKKRTVVQMTHVAHGPLVFLFSS